MTFQMGPPRVDALSAAYSKASRYLVLPSALHSAVTVQVHVQGHV